MSPAIIKINPDFSLEIWQMAIFKKKPSIQTLFGSGMIIIHT